MLTTSLLMWVPQVANFLKAGVPSCLLRQGSLNVYYNLVMVLVGLSALVVSCGSMVVAMFLMSMSPLSARHWKHMTPAAWIGVFAFIVLYFFALMADGGSIPDQLLVIWPILVGLGLCLNTFAMKPKAVDPAFDKLDSEEKQS
jgi:hypothetical protein